VHNPFITGNIQNFCKKNP